MDNTTAATEVTLSTQAALEAVAEAATTTPDTSTALESAKDVAPKTETPKTPEADPQAAKFAALSRREKALKAQERSLAQRAKEFEEKLKLASESKVDDAKYIDVDAFKKNPYEYMKKHGLTLEQVAEIALNDGKITPESLVKQAETKLEKQIRELQEKLEVKEAKEIEQRYEQVLQGFKADMTKFVNDTEDYEMIRATDSVQTVYDVIETNFNNKIAEFAEEYGREATEEERREFILDNKTACDMVEAWLLDQEKAKIEKLRSLKKTKGLFEPLATKVEPKVKDATTTLTNTLSAQVPSKDSKKLTAEESLKEAAKLIKWNN